MMNVVGTNCLLANAFFVVGQDSSISVEWLRRAVRAVSQSIAQFDAVVSFDRQRLNATLFNYCDLFVRDGNSISLVSDPSDYFSDDYFEIVFNEGLSVETVNAMRGALKECPVN